jgi:hypothetical protein
MRAASSSKHAVEADDELMMKFFEDGEDAISVDELKAALRKRVLAGDFFLVTGGDGRGVIVEKAARLSWPTICQAHSTSRLSGALIQRQAMRSSASQTNQSHAASRLQDRNRPICR